LELSRLLPNLLLAASALIVSAVSGELLLRGYYGVKHSAQAPRARIDPQSSDAYDDPADFYGRYDTSARVEYSTYLGYQPTPRFEGRGYRTNVHSLRHQEDFPPARQPGELRTFVTGGSTAWGAGVRQEQLYSSVAEAALRQSFPGRRVVVAAAGVRGYCSVQERILVENSLLRLSPNVVVMFSGWNDSYFGYSGTDILAQQDQMGFGSLVARNRGDRLPQERGLEPPLYEDYALKLRFVADVALYKWRYGRPVLLEQAIERHALPVEQVLETLALNAAILADLGKRRDFKLVLYLQPSIYDTRKALSGWERLVVLRAEQQYVGFPEYNRKVYAAYRRSLPERAEKDGYLFVDGDLAIAAEAKAVFADHVHLGSRGNRLVGQHLAGVLERLAR
jgi:lysophospholipase L1-like esterase